MRNTWTYRDETYRSGTNLAGFDVEATDGSIGSIDEDSTDRDHLIVDTGFWIFGKRRLLPVGVVERINYDEEKVYVGMTKEQIKNAPDLDEHIDHHDSAWDRSHHDNFYDPYVW